VQSEEIAKPCADALNSLKPVDEFGSNLNCPEVFTFKFTSLFQVENLSPVMFIFAELLVILEAGHVAVLQKPITDEAEEVLLANAPVNNPPLQPVLVLFNVMVPADNKFVPFKPISNKSCAPPAPSIVIPPVPVAWM
jgi:hypothetical protein